MARFLLSRNYKKLNYCDLYVKKFFEKTVAQIFPEGGHV